MEDAPVVCISQGQKHVALSVTEAELYAAVAVAQYMLYVMNFLESLQLKVNKPMLLEIDNKVCVDLINNWSVAGRTRHVDCRKNFMRELKEENVMRFAWLKGEENDSDIFTKNVTEAEHRKHDPKYVGNDEYNKE